MRVTPELLQGIQDEIEKIDYGTVVIKINESGKFVEISSERRKRIWKEGADGIVRGVEKQYIHEDYHRG
jgi:hypothetical protein